MAAGIPILMYHEVTAAANIEPLARVTQRGYLIDEDGFEQHLRVLAEQGFTPVSLDVLAQPASAPRPERPIVITFDDGFAGNYRYAFPALQRHGFSATFFIVSERIEGPHMMRWSELAEMARHGMQVESHTATHPLLSTLDEARTRAELVQSKQTIEHRLGRPVRYLSLPSGDSNRWYPRLAAQGGYLGGCSSRLGFNDASTDRWHWRRIAVKGRMDAEHLRRLVTREPRTWIKARAAALAKSALARALGKKNYQRLYVRVFGVDQDAAGGTS